MTRFLVWEIELERGKKLILEGTKHSRYGYIMSKEFEQLSESNGWNLVAMKQTPLWMWDNNIKLNECFANDLMAMTNSYRTRILPTLA